MTVKYLIDHDLFEASSNGTTARAWRSADAIAEVQRLLSEVLSNV